MSRARPDVAGRRDFLRRVAIGAPLLLLSPGCALRPRTRAREWQADLLVIGGGVGGCAATLAAAEHGLSVVMTESTDWIGGQLTAQAVPPDENAWIETIGGTQRYRALREGVRDWTRAHRPLTERARRIARLNPGNGWVSRVCAEPRGWLAVLEGLLAPHIAAGRVRVLREHAPVAADVVGDTVRAVTVAHVHTGQSLVLSAPYVIDATELGTLLPLAGIEHVTGAESRAVTGEPQAPEAAQPDNEQGFTVCFAMEHAPGETHIIDRPDDYAHWRAVVLDPPDGARLLSFDDPGSKRIGFDPVARTGFWSYRRVIDRDLLDPASGARDVTIVNWGQNDYSFGSLTQGTAADAARHEAAARSLGRALLYWLQTECPRPDGGLGWPGLRLRPDIMGTADGFAKAPYIRESRRIQAVTTVREPQVTVAGRVAATGRPREQLRAEAFPDSVGIGHYSLDLHRTTRGDHGVYAETLPFQLPLGALLPVRCTNLLAAAKNIGVTHRTNGCYRLHPIEWNAGEAAGALVAFCRRRGVPPHAVHARPVLLAEFQAQLRDDGVPLAWPDPLPR